MRKWIATAFLAGTFTLVLAVPAYADNPHPSGTTGQPGQSCQNYSASTRPGNSGSSPGSPFNEPGINSTNGGTGGAHYSETSQYDVACFQHAQHHA